MTRLLPSSPAYALFHELWDIYAIAVNPQCCFFPMPDDALEYSPFINENHRIDMDAWEVHAASNALYEQMEIMLETPIEFLEWEMKI